MNVAIRSVIVLSMAMLVGCGDIDTGPSVTQALPLPESPVDQGADSPECADPRYLSTPPLSADEIEGTFVQSAQEPALLEMIFYGSPIVVGGVVIEVVGPRFNQENGEPWTSTGEEIASPHVYRVVSLLVESVLRDDIGLKGDTVTFTVHGGDTDAERNHGYAIAPFGVGDDVIVALAPWPMPMREGLLECIRLVAGPNGVFHRDEAGLYKRRVTEAIYLSGESDPQDPRFHEAEQKGLSTEEIRTLLALSREDQPSWLEDGPEWEDLRGGRTVAEQLDIEVQGLERQVEELRAENEDPDHMCRHVDSLEEFVLWLEDHPSKAVLVEDSGLTLEEYFSESVPTQCENYPYDLSKYETP